MSELNLDDNGTEILWFTAKWCRPCQTMAPIFDQLVAEGYTVKKIDIDVEVAFSRQHGIYAVPTFISMKNGETLGRTSGARPKADLMKLLKLT